MSDSLCNAVMLEVRAPVVKDILNGYTVRSRKSKDLQVFSSCVSPHHNLLGWFFFDPRSQFAHMPELNTNAEIFDRPGKHSWEELLPARPNLRNRLA